MINLMDLVTTCEIFPEDVNFDVRRVGKPGKEFDMRTQKGYFRKPSQRFPILFKFTLPEDQRTAYPAGLYFIHPDSFVAGDYDSLELSRFDFKLIPIPTELQKLTSKAA